MGFLGDISLKASLRLNLFGAALPGAGNDLFEHFDTNHPSFAYYVIYFCASSSGVLSIARSWGGTTYTESLNSGEALVAAAAYMFTIPVTHGQLFSLRYSGSGTIHSLIVVEQAGTAG